jgi:gamma-glutamyl:cysteine ligase YbdK (ATP-grasp superfamily)
MSKKKKNSIESVMYYLESQQMLAEVQGIIIVSKTLGNIIQKIKPVAEKLYENEMELQYLKGQNAMLKELNAKMDQKQKQKQQE